MSYQKISLRIQVKIKLEITRIPRVRANTLIKLCRRFSKGPKIPIGKYVVKLVIPVPNIEII